VKVSKYTRTEIIVELEQAWRTNTVTLGLVEYGEFATARALLERVKKTLLNPHLSAEKAFHELRQHLRNLPPIGGLSAAGATKAQGGQAEPLNGAQGKPSSESTTVEKEQLQAQPTPIFPAQSPVEEQPKPAGPPAPPANGRLTFKQLAYWVLLAKGPATAGEIWEHGNNMGLAQRVQSHGMTPADSIASKIYQDMLHTGSAFLHADGKFAVKSGAAAPPAQRRIAGAGPALEPGSPPVNAPGAAGSPGTAGSQTASEPSK